MTRDIDQFHPDNIINSRWGRRLPRKWKKRFQLVFVGLGWYGVISSIVGIASGLTWVISAAAWLYSKSGALKPILLSIGNGIHEAVAFWRTITEPLHHLLFGWLPFAMPKEVLDSLVIAFVVISGYLRAWVATAQERRLMAIFSRYLSEEGKIAIVKRIRAANYVLSGDYSERAKDKAEAEITSALEEMSCGVSNKDFRVIEEALDLEPDELDAFLRRCAEAERQAAATRDSIVRRATILALVLSLCIAIDFAYIGLV